MTSRIYDMELFDDLDVGGSCTLTRVPGGWIYKEYDEQVGGHIITSMVFIPYHNEFHKPVLDNGDE